MTSQRQRVKHEWTDRLNRTVRITEKFHDERFEPLLAVVIPGGRYREKDTQRYMDAGDLLFDLDFDNARIMHRIIGTWLEAAPREPAHAG